MNPKISSQGISGSRMLITQLLLFFDLHLGLARVGHEPLVELPVVGDGAGELDLERVVAGAADLGLGGELAGELDALDVDVLDDRVLARRHCGGGDAGAGPGGGGAGGGRGDAGQGGRALGVEHVVELAPRQVLGRAGLGVSRSMKSMMARPMNRTQPKSPRPKLSPPLALPPGRGPLRRGRSGRCSAMVKLPCLTTIRSS